MLHPLFQYLKFLLVSKNQHGVHSPFVYNLITKCFYTKVDKTHYKEYLATKKRLAVCKEITKKEESFRKPKLILKVIQYFKPTNILVIGSASNIGISALKIANPKALINVLEPVSKKGDEARNALLKKKFSSINFIVGDLKETLSKVVINKQFDLIFFHKIYTKAHTLSYFESCLCSIHNDTFLVFSDIHKNKEITVAWLQIKQHPKVRVTINVFNYGFVFFRKEQEKEHFTIRI